MKYLTIVLIGGLMTLACLGCSPVSSVAGIYAGPLYPYAVSKSAAAAQRLILKSDSTYEHKTYEEPKYYSVSSYIQKSGHIPSPNVYKGTFTVKGEEVILHGEPPEAYGTFKIVGKDLRNHWGLWKRKKD